MAALTLTPVAVRQPFAPLDAPRLRSILRTKMNVLNKQNGNMLSGKKQPLAEFDSENIDPSALKSTKSTKRKRSADDEDDHTPAKSPMKPMKSSSVSFAIFEDSIAPSTPTKNTQSTPKFAPLKPAGRSPQMKASKPFARRATVSKSRPESARKGIGRPFSLAAALSSGKSKSKSQAAAPAPKMPASWSFEIYVDSEQEEMTNLMQHSTCVLDISDDEDKEEIKSDYRGKENIPPADLGISLPRTRQQESPAAAARKSDMGDEPRSPLGELNAADYYGEDCHAFSYAVIFDEEDEAPFEKKVTRSKLSSMSSIESVLEAAENLIEKPVEDSA
ncbi:hypothetical protein BDW74DRAFT_154926 [Aspergillus multicolor]|uniref:uncharacterized protein n=1 Tax=Aspergillus multicolor TaxID=41759 RepID=UPI003CCDA5B1